MKAAVASVVALLAAVWAGAASGAVIVERELVVDGLADAAGVASTAGGKLVVADRRGPARGVVERYTAGGARLGGTMLADGVEDVAVVGGLDLPWRVLLPRGSRLTLLADGAGSDGVVLAEEAARFTGATAGGTGGGRVYAADFRRGLVRVLDGQFNSLTDIVFNDETIPAGYAPYKIEKLGDRLYVAYARRGPRATLRPGRGTGFVDVFDGHGTLRRRLVTNKKLNAPTGMTIGPEWMGEFAGDLLVANAGDGTISAYDRATGGFEGQVRNANGVVMRIDGLSDIHARHGELYVTSDRGVERLAGVGDEGHVRAAKAAGRVGAMTSVPEPGLGLVVVLLAGVCGLRRR